MIPPRRPENNEGYFEYIEGPVGTTGAMTPPWTVAQNTLDGAASNDTTVGDFDDILMFTTRSVGRPFVGRYGATTIQSDVAEVAWFLRGRTLHRRVLLVAPSLGAISGGTNSFYINNDISVHRSGANAVVANTLADLTDRGNRFAHRNAFPESGYGGWSYWTWTVGTATTRIFPTLPTLRECTATGWLPLSQTSGSISDLDFWAPGDANHCLSDEAYASSTTRISDDAILTNVIGFDVKAWDPASETVGAYVDLGYDASLDTYYSDYGDARSGWTGTADTPRVYDTYSTSHENPEGSDGFDSNGNGIVDDILEKAQSVTYGPGIPPYPVPLRGVQVKIRVFEPDSRQVREVSVIQNFLPQ